jgi:hypothetical protein
MIGEAASKAEGGTSSGYFRNTGRRPVASTRVPCPTGWMAPCTLERRAAIGEVLLRRSVCAAVEGLWQHGSGSMTGGKEARLLERQPWPALSGCQSISQSASRPPGRVSEEQSQRHSLSFSLPLAQLHSCSPSRRRPMCRRRHEGASADRTADVGEHSLPLPLPRRRRGPAARAAAHGGRQQALSVLTGKATTAKSGGRGSEERAQGVDGVAGVPGVGWRVDGRASRRRSHRASSASVIADGDHRRRTNTIACGVKRARRPLNAGLDTKRRSSPRESCVWQLGRRAHTTSAECPD